MEGRPTPRDLVELNAWLDVQFKEHPVELVAAVPVRSLSNLALTLMACCADQRRAEQHETSAAPIWTEEQRWTYIEMMRDNVLDTLACVIQQLYGPEPGDPVN